VNNRHSVAIDRHVASLVDSGNGSTDKEVYTISRLIRSEFGGIGFGNGDSEGLRGRFRFRSKFTGARLLGDFLHDVADVRATALFGALFNCARLWRSSFLRWRHSLSGNHTTGHTRRHLLNLSLSCR
jgi:hypothetical protein